MGLCTKQPIPRVNRSKLVTDQGAYGLDPCRDGAVLDPAVPKQRVEIQCEETVYRCLSVVG